MCFLCLENYPDASRLEEFEYVKKVKSAILPSDPSIKGHDEASEEWDIYLDFLQLLQDYEEAPTPRRAVVAQIKNFFWGNLDLVDGFDEFMWAAFPKQCKMVSEKEASLITAHGLACEKQASSRLMSLPRELRDKIWAEAVTGNVFHVTKAKEEAPSVSPCKPRFHLHLCRAANGLASSACPPGIGDHTDCMTSGPVEVSSFKRVCKQIYLELPTNEATIFSRSAFQFADMGVAEEFLFGIAEPDRAAIRHLRFALPSELIHGHSHYHSYIPSSWGSICNYFSNPWTRNCLRMVPEEDDPPEELKMPISFYYSSCYYENNKDRLHKRYQVRRGNTSWDVSIAGLRWKGEPRVDIAIEEPPLDGDRPPWNPRGDNGSGEEESYEDEDEEEAYVGAWAAPLSQFKQYHGLSLKLYNKEGLKVTPEFEDYASRLQNILKGNTIGPWKVPNFEDSGRYGDVVGGA